MILLDESYISLALFFAYSETEQPTTDTSAYCKCIVITLSNCVMNLSRSELRLVKYMIISWGTYKSRVTYKEFTYYLFGKAN